MPNTLKKVFKDGARTGLNGGIVDRNMTLAYHKRQILPADPKPEKAELIDGCRHHTVWLVQGTLYMALSGDSGSPDNQRAATRFSPAHRPFHIGGYLPIVSTSTFPALEYWSLSSRSSLRMSKIHLSICSLPWRRQKRFGISGDVREPLGRRRGGILLEDNTTKALGLMVPVPTVLKQIKAATGVEWVVVGGGGRACRAHRRELKMELAWF
jgi:hypothetical protein